MTEVITEDTPEEGVEMLQYKLDAVKTINNNLNENLKVVREEMNHYRAVCNDYKNQINRLVENMTVGQLKAAGIIVNITIPSDEDEDD